jgi:predicted amidohydrolase YtcJ
MASSPLRQRGHVFNNSAVSDLLDTLEKVNKVQPICKLRWTLGHVYDISSLNIARAKALGMTLGVHGAAMRAGAHMPLRKIADIKHIHPTLTMVGGRVVSSAAN